MSFSKTWSEADLGSTYQDDIDDIVEDTRIGIRERLNVEHYAYADETDEVDVMLHRKEAGRCDTGLAANKPAAAATAGTSGAVEGYLYYETDTGLLRRYDATDEEWDTIGSPDHSNLDTTYTTGTADFENASATVAGTGTEWSTYIAQYDVIKGADGEYYNIISVDSDTQLTLDRNYDGDTAAGQSYTIYLNGHPQYLGKSGGTVDGPVTMGDAIAMGDNKVTGLAAASEAGDAVRYEQLVGAYPLLKTGSYTGDGNATQAVTGVGADLTSGTWFLLIFSYTGITLTLQVNDVAGAITIDSYGSDSDVADGTTYLQSVDSDGFTVTNNSHPGGNSLKLNATGVVYRYVILRS